MVSLVRHAEPTEIADVLTECQSAVHLETRQGDKLVVLSCETVDSLAESLVVLRLPPGAQYAACIGLRPLVVEAMTHFVTDHATDTTVIDCRICVGVKERRLEDG